MPSREEANDRVQHPHINRSRVLLLRHSEGDIRFTTGTRIGHYEVISPLGAGGMGEVYRARDTQLDREVAIKIVPDLFAADSDRLMRFEREAKTLASMNHPNIAQVYGLEPLAAEGAQSGRALVMEFVDGVTLDRHVAAVGASPSQVIPDTVRIARQIAEALEYAHERGVIHRDLKPANVILTADGIVKVLDFGLAKALAPQGAGGTEDAAGMVNSPTFTSPALTNMGVILGTAAYMAPEQAKGKPVDRRADIWALGVVVFEMLTGQRMYGGETVTDTIVQVITQPPKWELLPPSTPAAIRRVLRRCLEKEPRNRFQSAGDVRVELDEYLAEPDAAVPATASESAQRDRRSYLPWGIAAALVIALAATLWFTRRSPVEAEPIRLLAELGTGVLAQDENVDGALAVLSPDGQTLAYRAVHNNRQQLFVRRLNDLSSQPLAGTDNALQQTFSPDGKWIAFFSAGALKKVSLSGGAAVTITPTGTEPRGLTWGSADIIVYTESTTSGLSRVAASGGTPVEITQLASGERTHRWPSFLPDGKTVIFTCQRLDGSYDEGTIEAVRVDHEKPARTVLGRGTFPRYLPSGHLAFIRETTLFAVPFDVGALKTTGDPVPVLSGIQSHGGTAAGVGDGASQIAFSDNGTAVYLTGTATDQTSRIFITDRAGKVLHQSVERLEFRSPRFSPDGRLIAVQVRTGRSDNVHVYNPDRGTLTKVTFDSGASGFPVWSPDGKQLVYFSDRGGGANVFMTRSDGGGEPAALTQGNITKIPTSFSPDGQTIAGMSQTPQGFDLFTLSLADKKLTALTSTPTQEMVPMISPDGKWIAYQFVEGTISDVFIRPLGSGGGKWQVSAGGGFTPVWTKHGTELIYLGVGGERTAVMSAPVSVDGDAVRPAKPHRLFDTSLSRASNSTFMDVTKDGNRIVIIRDDREAVNATVTHVTFIFNFLTEVRRAVATKQ